MFTEGSGSLFGAEVPEIEHEHDDEHDSPNFGIWAESLLRRSTPNPELQTPNSFTVHPANS